MLDWSTVWTAFIVIQQNKMAATVGRRYYVFDNKFRTTSVT